MLLLVVLSMLVLFLLMGTAFLMTASYSRTSAIIAAKRGRLGNSPSERLDRALMTLLRDTEQPNSAIRYHSLLRDLYGTDGFQGVIYSPPPNAVFDPTNPAQQVTRFAGGTANTNSTAPARENFGPTQGQFVDIYVRQLAYGADDPLTPAPTNEANPANQAADLRHVLKLARNVQGQLEVQTLPVTKGYYNGCLLTITSGPAAGQTTRILEYEFVRNMQPSSTDPPLQTRLFRFRVMAFPRADGQPLAIDQRPGREPEISDLAGATFIVNGRAFNGTGFGYNPLALTGQPRLSMVERFPYGGGFVGGEIALLPNLAYLDLSLLASLTNATTYNPFAPGLNQQNFLLLNPPGQFRGRHYGIGPGDADESYDAADFQNMWLSLVTATPRATGRVVLDGNLTYEISAPEVVNAQGAYVSGDKFLRLDLENLPWPSFHRPDLINYWYHRMLMLISEGKPTDAHVRAILQPFNPVSGAPTPPLNPQQAALITAIKRRISMRPIREDNPNFDGGNPRSVPPANAYAGQLLRNGNIAIPYWEVVGPWDVDNDNDGIPESNWVDLGDPIQEREDGTRYKALYAFHVIDLDSRLNVNAHGLADHISPPDLALVQNVSGELEQGPNLAGTRGGVPNPPRYSSNILAQGTGYGPAEISLRPVFPLPWADVSGGLDRRQNRVEGNGSIDSYATLLSGRVKLDQTAVSGKYGYLSVVSDAQYVAPGINYDYSSSRNPSRPTGDNARPELAAQLKFFNYPWSIDRFVFFPTIPFSPATAFGSPPDLFGRYGLGIDYMGQPVFEAQSDVNPATQTLPPNQWRANHLLVNSPYELDLSSPQRRDTWQASFLNSTDAFAASLDLTATGGGPGVNDDAPFATADLERVLRAFDADAGTLPSRLWDVVDVFDPLKLMTYDPYRTASVANALFDPTGSSISPNDSNDQPQMLAAAQQMAAISRRLVTTDSADLPVAAGTVSNQTELAVGADGRPGRRGQNDPDSLASVDDVSEINSPNSDDFRTLFGKEASQANIIDLLRYRVWKQVRLQLMRENSLDEAGVDQLANNAATYTNNFLVPISQRAEALINGETFTDTNNNGMYDNGENYVDVNGNRAYDPPLAQLLAPEIYAGVRMDLNRPFGDGVDNNGNGVVDDPLEAGEPFLDVNGNGKWDVGEVFLDIFPGDHDPAGSPYAGRPYDGPIDQLWANLTPGTISEPITFDYTNGQGVSIHPEVAGNAPSAKVRNLGSQARQLYARHLYCLALLEADENYIAPHDENDPQVQKFLDHTATGSQAKAIHDALMAAGSVDPVQETRQIMLRKLTCRMIAQWAVNCADIRDADAIMTPFEYDENPWDGWGVPDSTTNGSTVTPINLPLDGDPATDENLGMTINWAAVNPGNPSMVKPIVAIPALPSPLNQTRGVVWGAERPELLITETMAFHDRRTEDLASDHTRSQLEVGNPLRDSELDQRLRPKGSVFIELYNPWSPTGQYPAELYSRLMRNAQLGTADWDPSQGIELGRLSTLGVDAATGGLSNRMDMQMPSEPVASVKRSPVWRMIVVQEHPRYRNDDKYDDGDSSTLPPDTGLFEPADPDSVLFDPLVVSPDEAYVERSFYFTSDNSDRYRRGESPQSIGTNALLLQVKKPEDKLRLPPAVVQDDFSAGARYFIAGDMGKAIDKTQNLEDQDVSIAPIKPGRYAVVGTAGAQYLDSKTGRPIEGVVEGLPQDNSTIAGVPRYVTTVSRRFLGDATQTKDEQHVPGIDQTRRIELLPSINPEVQQVIVAGNGGTPLFPNQDSVSTPATPNPPPPVQRDNEIVKLPNSEFLNIYDRDSDNVPDTGLITPIVAIPVAHMSISEPLDLYAARETELNADEKANAQGPPGTSYVPVSHYYDPLAAQGEGMYTQNVSGGGVEGPFDKPFDDPNVTPELCRNGTTRNYRMIHLQRLADPTLPWNPLPTLSDGEPNPQHDPKLPVNLYRTIDTASVDLTAFNGTSSREPESSEKPDPDAVWLPRNNLDFQRVYRPKTGNEGPQEQFHRLSFRSLERGAHATDLVTKDAGLRLAPRLLWRQEPETRYVPADDPNDPKTDMLEWQTLNTDDLRRTWLLKRANDLRIRTVGRPDQMGELLKDIEYIAKSLDGDFNNFPDALQPRQAHFDIVMEHTLGFQNEAFGALTTVTDLAQQNLPLAARGAPMLDSNFSRAAPNNDPVDSTYPWLAWGNRPFVSAEELLGVPATSSSQLLRKFSTITTDVNALPNPYDGRGTDDAGAPITIAARWALMHAPYGHLLNFFASAADVAQALPPAGTNPDPSNVGAPHFYRLLEYVQVPSRFVGTESLLTAEIFNDVPGTGNDAATGGDILNPADPRYHFQPPFNKISRQRDPGKVNLNTVTGHREQTGTFARHWSEVFDGIMHRVKDGNQLDAAGNPQQLGHLGPAWRDVVLSRKGYVQFNANGSGLTIEKTDNDLPPDVFAFGLNPNFPSIVSNPFRSPDAGDLVPLPQMVHLGVDAFWLRRHHFDRETGEWGSPNTDDNGDWTVDDTREAGFGGDELVFNPITGALLDAEGGRYPLFSESFTAPYIDGERNPSFYYQPMTRLGNLVTNRSNVFAVWITVGYFEVEPAPNWNDPNSATRTAVRARFGGTNNDNDPATVAALALYNRVYPDGYMLGKEVGSDTGDVNRHRGFYIIDRTEEVGFKPGEDLNVEDMIRLRRRID